MEKFTFRYGTTCAGVAARRLANKRRRERPEKAATVLTARWCWFYTEFVANFNGGHHQTKLNKWSFLFLLLFFANQASMERNIFSRSLYSEIQFSALLVAIYNSFSVYMDAVGRCVCIFLFVCMFAQKVCASASARVSRWHSSSFGDATRLRHWVLLRKFEDYGCAESGDI